MYVADNRTVLKQLCNPIIKSIKNNPLTQDTEKQVLHYNTYDFVKFCGLLI